MTEQIVYRLSSVDHSFLRTYIRCSLCYPRSDDSISKDEVTSRLTASVKRALQHYPILAGRVVSANSLASLPSPHSVQSSQKPRRESIESFTSTYHSHRSQRSNDENLFTVLNKDRRASTESRYGGEQRGHLEVRLTAEQVEGFKPSVVTETSEDTGSYKDLKGEGMPASTFIGQGVATPLADLPDPAQGQNPVFAVQARFIEGGLLVSLYLHHSVADIHGLAKVIRCMSNQPALAPSAGYSTESLRKHAAEDGKCRDRLSGCRGFKADVASHPEYDIPKGRNRTLSTLLVAPSNGTGRVLSFDLSMISKICDMVNMRLSNTSHPPSFQVTAFDCLAAMLWKAITRARWLYRPTEEGKSSMLLMPVNISKRIDPAVSDNYFGNVCLFSSSKSLRTRLMLPFDVGTIAEIAVLIHTSVVKVDETKVRSAIALINGLPDVRVVNHPSMDFEQDLFITDWTRLPTGEGCTLGVGLGPAEYIRKPSRQQSSYGCIVLPVNEGRGTWEVIVQMSADTMDQLVADPGLEPIVVRSARSRECAVAGRGY